MNCKAATCTAIEILQKKWSLFRVDDRLSEYTCYSDDYVGTLRTIVDFLTKWMELYIKLFCLVLLLTKKKEVKKKHTHKKDNLYVIRNQVSRVLIVPVSRTKFEVRSILDFFMYFGSPYCFLF